MKILGNKNTQSIDEFIIIRSIEIYSTLRFTDKENRKFQWCILYNSVYYFTAVHTQITSTSGVYIIHIDHLLHTEILTVLWSFDGIEYVWTSFDDLEVVIYQWL